jgi:hypothetical protein
MPELLEPDDYDISYLGGAVQVAPVSKPVLKAPTVSALEATI